MCDLSSICHDAMHSDDPPELVNQTVARGVASFLCTVKRRQIATAPIRNLETGTLSVDCLFFAYIVLYANIDIDIHIDCKKSAYRPSWPPC